MELWSPDCFGQPVRRRPSLLLRLSGPKAEDNAAAIVYIGIFALIIGIPFGLGSFLFLPGHLATTIAAILERRPP
jgi:hypothetical protein